MNQFISIKSSIFSNSDWQCSQSSGIGLDGDWLFTLSWFGELLAFHSHLNLSVSSSINDLFVLDGLNQNTQSIMQWSFGFIKNVLRWSSQDDGTSFVSLTSWESDDFVFTDQDFFNGIASTQNFILSLWAVKSWQNFSTEGSWDSFNSFEICMFDDSDTLFDQKLFWVIIDQLSIDKDGWFIGNNLVNFLFHFHFFSFGNFLDFFQWFDSDSGAVDFNLVVVHWRVGGQNFTVFNWSLAASWNGLFQDEAITKEGFLNWASELLNDLDVRKICWSFKSHDCLNGKISKVLFILGQKLWAQGSFGNVDQIVFEFFGVLWIVSGNFV